MISLQAKSHRLVALAALFVLSTGLSVSAEAAPSKSRPILRLGRVGGFLLATCGVSCSTQHLSTPERARVVQHQYAGGPVTNFQIGRYSAEARQVSLRQPDGRTVVLELAEAPRLEARRVRNGAEWTTIHYGIYPVRDAATGRTVVYEAIVDMNPSAPFTPGERLGDAASDAADSAINGAAELLLNPPGFR